MSDFTRLSLLAATIGFLALGCDREAECPPEVCGPPSYTATLLDTPSSDVELSYVTAAAIGDDRSVYIADAMHDGVLVLDSVGRRAKIFGKRGDGPGEFQLIRNVAVLPGDTLFVYDSQHGRASWFSTSRGSLLGERTLQTPAGIPWAVVPLSSGDLLLWYRDPFRSGVAAAQRGGDALRVLDPAGRLTDTIASFPSQQFLVRQDEQRIEVTFHPFGTRPIVVPGPDGAFHLVRTDSLAVRTRHPDGSWSRWRRPLVYEPPAAEEVEYWVEALGEHYREVLGADTMRAPVVRNAVSDSRGRVWLGVRGQDIASNRWIRLDTQAGTTAAVDLPRGVELVAARGSLLIGTRTDEDDVPTLIFLTLSTQR